MPLRVGASAAALLVLGALLAGCTIPPSPVEPTTAPVVKTTPSATPVATPSAEATTASAVDELVLRPTAMELWSGGRVVESLAYMSPSTSAIARLSQVFGREPRVEWYEGGNHFPDGNDYTWGAVTLRVEDLEFEWGTRPRSLLNPEFKVIFSGPSEGPVGLRASNGTRAGDVWSAVERIAPADGYVNCAGDPVERQRADTPDGLGGSSVVVTPDWVDGRPGDVVRWLRAPDVESPTGGCA